MLNTNNMQQNASFKLVWSLQFKTTLFDCNSRSCALVQNYKYFRGEHSIPIVVAVILDKILDKITPATDTLVIILPQKHAKESEFTTVQI